MDHVAAKTIAPCPLCGSTELTTKHHQAPYSVLHCRACDFGFTHPMPTEAALAAFYSSAYFSGGVPGEMGYHDYVRDEATHRANAAPILDAIAGVRPAAGGDLLDVGCAHGFFVDEANRRGWRARGVDMSADAIAHARTSLGVDAVEGTLHSLHLPDQSLDAVVMVGSLDHVTDPFAIMAEAKRILRPGGVFAASLGDIAGLLPFHWKPPEHLTYFSRKSLRAALVRAGFIVESIRLLWTQYALEEFLLRVQMYVKIPIPIPKLLLKAPLRLTIPTNEVLVVTRKPM